MTKLIHVEPFETPDAAIKREKQIKSWRREKRIYLIDSRNPAWDDLAAEWCGGYKESPPAAEK